MELQIKGETNESLMNKLHELCAFTPKYYNFPGSLPVSLSRNDLWYLKRNYTVCDKTDGTRYLMLCTDKKLYLVDRLMNFYFINCLGMENFVYDGELVQDLNNSKRWYFMIFDVFATNNRVVKDVPDHSKRIKIINGITPIDINCNELYLHIQTKRFYYTSEIKDCMLNTQKLPYKTDGYIFTPVYRKIFNGTDKRTYKWKSGTDHTIDFELRENGNIYLWDKNNNDILICEIEYEHEEDKFEFNSDIKIPCIVECKIIKKGEESSWVFIKRRDDKERPNSMKTYLSTINVINENITERDLNLNLSIR